MPGPSRISRERSGPGGPLRIAVGAIVDASGRHPVIVIVSALCVLAFTWVFALRVLLHPRTDLRELLPQDSPGLLAFEHQLSRVGGGATILVVVESPARRENERFIDALSARLDELVAAQKQGEPKLIAYVESGTKDVHRFFERNKWLYADRTDLESALETLDLQIAVRSGLVSDLSDAAGGREGAMPALGLDEYRDRWEAEARRRDDFPGGYFETKDGSMIGLRIVSSTTGMGDAAGDALLGRLKRLVSDLAPASYHPDMKIGFAGDVPNAVAEKDSVVSQAVWASTMALSLILAGVVWFFRSPWAVIILGLPALLGVGAAYAFAWVRFGYVNTTGMFLGAIILGNGINYPIVLLSRYGEFKARGLTPADARREAVQNALRAELVGASVASIAYGSLTVTEFRGFNQFGWIGLFGMLLVWASMIPCVPALIVTTEWMQTKVPMLLRGGTPGLLEDGSRRSARWLAAATARAPGLVAFLAVTVTALAVWRVPAFLRDPWEYDFDRLGSRGSKQGGAGEWSNKAERVFGGKMNVAGALMLADAPEQVPWLKAQIVANDAEDPEGPIIAEIATISDLLPGGTDEQNGKLELLARIRDRLTPAVLADLSGEERERVAYLTPPESLHAIEPSDLPLLLRRRFEENDGRVGTVFYVRYKDSLSLSNGRILLRAAKATDNVALADGTVVRTASRATIFAEMIKSMRKDGPRAMAAALLAVSLVVILATRDLRGALAVLAALAMAVTWLLGGAAYFGEKLNYVNFIALPITFGIGCEYPFNIYDRSRLLGGDVVGALGRVGGAVALCSYTTAVGYSSLLFSDFQALQSFGRLAACGEAVCLIGALLTLPALLHLTSRRSAKTGAPCSRAES
jgi:predicted RND superfamily exporter protein